MGVHRLMYKSLRTNFIIYNNSILILRITQTLVYSAHFGQNNSQQFKQSTDTFGNTCWQNTIAYVYRDVLLYIQY